LQQGPQDPADRAELEDLAATLPELFGTLELGCLSRIAQRLGVESDGDELLELLLLSESRVQVLRPLSSDPELALVAASDSVGNIGLVLSRVHAEVALLEAKK
jgi:hypothetical protein